MNAKELKAILDAHKKWTIGDGGQRADLRGAYLQDANLQRADLRGANLQRADLQDADLQDANLRGAYLQDANLQRADLQDANLQGADLRGAYLQDANLQRADLRGADLRGANLPHFQICPETGSFDAWKRVTNTAGGTVIKIRIPAKAKRTSSLTGRKCRAEFVKVLKGNGNGKYDGTVYTEGETVKADSFDPDIRVECTHGIHFYMTKKEAEEY